MITQISKAKFAISLSVLMSSVPVAHGQDIRSDLTRAMQMHAGGNAIAAISIVDKHCRAGVPYACFMVGTWFMLGDKVKMDTKNALGYLGAADAGQVPQASHMLGVMYMANADPSVLPRDLVKAQTFFRRSIDLQKRQNGGTDGKSEMELAKLLHHDGKSKEACDELKNALRSKTIEPSERRSVREAAKIIQCKV